MSVHVVGSLLMSKLEANYNFQVKAKSLYTIEIRSEPARNISPQWGDISLQLKIHGLYPIFYLRPRHQKTGFKKGLNDSDVFIYV